MPKTWQFWMLDRTSKTWPISLHKTGVNQLKIRLINYKKESPSACKSLKVPSNVTQRKHSHPWPQRSKGLKLSVYRAKRCSARVWLWWRRAALKWIQQKSLKLATSLLKFVSAKLAVISQSHHRWTVLFQRSPLLGSRPIVNLQSFPSR